MERCQNCNVRKGKNGGGSNGRRTEEQEVQAAQTQRKEDGSLRLCIGRQSRWWPRGLKTSFARNKRPELKIYVTDAITGAGYNVLKNFKNFEGSSDD